MPRPRIHNKSYLKERRRQLRADLTPAEALLWSGLKNNQLEGRRFRRQHSILNYIVDFYCAEERLIIELDGQHHYEAGGLERDGERDSILASLGFNVIRIENVIVINNSAEVLEYIASHFKVP